MISIKKSPKIREVYPNRVVKYSMASVIIEYEDGTVDTLGWNLGLDGSKFNQGDSVELTYNIDF